MLQTSMMPQSRKSTLVIIVTAIPVGSNPIGIIVSPDGSKIYAVNSSSNTVSVISAVENTNIITVAVGINPFGVAVNPAGTFVYVTNSGENSISVIKTVDHSVITNWIFLWQTLRG
jgi:YVTN family beta-propeller protein